MAMVSVFMVLGLLWLDPVVAVTTSWTPLKGRNKLFPEPGLDWKDPWQFQNFRVS